MLRCNLKKWLALNLFAMGVCSFVMASAARAADWPQWGGTGNRNLVSAETNLPGTFEPGKKKPDGSGIDLATTKNVKWTARLGGTAYGNPTVAAGRVFVGTDDATLVDDPRFVRTKGGLVKCFDEADGRLLWQLAVPERGNLPKGMWFTHQFLGICSSPTVENDRVYVVTCANEVLCLDVHGQANGNDGPFQDEGQYMAGPDKPSIKLTDADADIIWRLDLIDDVGVRPHDAASCSILIHGDLLYLSTSNGLEVTHTRMIAPEAPSFLVVDKRTGKLAAYENELSPRLYHAQWCSPSLGKVGDKTLILLGGGDGVCYAYEALESVPEKPVLLKTVWTYDAIPAAYKYVDGKTVPYYDGDKRKANGPNKNDGLFVGPSEIIGTPVFADGRVYFAIGQDPAHGRGRGMLHCVDASGKGDITKTGCIWTYDDTDRSLSTVAVADGLVYSMDVAGRLHCVDAKTGKPYWVEETKAEAWGGPLVADGKLFFGNKNDFYIMAAGKEAKVLDKIRLGSPVYSTPVAANGVLYIASQRYLWAVEKKGE